MMTPLNCFSLAALAISFACGQAPDQTELKLAEEQLAPFLKILREGTSPSLVTLTPSEFKRTRFVASNVDSKVKSSDFADKPFVASISWNSLGQDTKIHSSKEAAEKAPWEEPGKKSGKIADGYRPLSYNARLFYVGGKWRLDSMEWRSASDPVQSANMATGFNNKNPWWSTLKSTLGQDNSNLKKDQPLKNNEAKDPAHAFLSSAQAMADYHASVMVKLKRAENDQNRLLEKQIREAHSKELKTLTGKNVVWQTQVKEISDDGEIRTTSLWKGAANPFFVVSCGVFRGQKNGKDIDPRTLRAGQSVVIRGNISRIQLNGFHVLVTLSDVEISLK